MKLLPKILCLILRNQTLNWQKLDLQTSKKHRQRGSSKEFVRAQVQEKVMRHKEGVAEIHISLQTMAMQTMAI